MHPNRGISEELSVLATALGTGSSTPLATAHIKFDKCRRMQLIARFGDMAAEAIDVGIYGSSDASGTGAALIKSITQLASHASNNDNKTVTIDLAQMEVLEAKPFISGRITTGGATGGTCAMVLLGGNLRESPPESIDEAGVVQIVR